MTLQNHYHAVVWIDHRESRVVYFNAGDVEQHVIHSHQMLHHFHSPEGVRHVEDKKYFHDIAVALTDAHRFLIVGPSSAKTEFAAYLKDHAPQLPSRLAAVEPMDKCTDGELVAHARRFFKTDDVMQPQTE
jgi:stalled ribosome rescue protein Dom34